MDDARVFGLSQAYHNLKPENHYMPDPDLTQRGNQQAEKLRTTFPYHDVVDLVVSSPIRRALQTALLGFEEELNRGLKIMALPDLQETSSLPCDTGTDIKKLEKEFGSTGKVDLSLVDEGWNKKVFLPYTTVFSSFFPVCPSPAVRPLKLTGAALVWRAESADCEATVQNNAWNSWGPSMLDW
jgi:hypothetical protein